MVFSPNCCARSAIFFTRVADTGRPLETRECRDRGDGDCHDLMDDGGGEGVMVTISKVKEDFLSMLN